jgi:hypothetical protein
MDPTCGVQASAKEGRLSGGAEWAAGERGCQEGLAGSEEKRLVGGAWDKK